MKLVLACEGQCEVVLIQSLLDKKQLVFKNAILLAEPLNIRQLREISSVINMLPVNEDIVVFRIGDTLKEEFSLKGFELREKHIEIFRICTKTEIEMLAIINEGFYKEYLKSQRTTKPKEFIKRKIKNFDFAKYVKSHDLLGCIKEYKSLKGKKHSKDEYTLFDLIYGFAKTF